MTNKDILLAFLKKNHIAFTLTEHPPVHSVSDIDLFDAHTNGAQTKTLVLWNKKDETFLMVIAPANQKIDIKNISKQSHIKNICFVPIKNLPSLFGAKAGSLSPFTLQIQSPKNLQIFISKDLLSQKYLAFHPHTNTATLDIETKDFLRYFKLLGKNYLTY